MQPYTFDFINRDGSIDTFDIGAFSDISEAMGTAQSALFVSLTAVGVEVWTEGARVGQIRRDFPPLSSTAKTRALSQRLSARASS